MTEMSNYVGECSSGASVKFKFKNLYKPQNFGFRQSQTFSILADFFIELNY